MDDRPRADATCPICSSSSRKEFQNAWHLVYRCGRRTCGHLFDPVASPLEGIVPGNVADEPTRYDDRNRYLARYWLRKGFLRPGSRVLDVGAGAGHVAGALMASIPGVQITCIEPCSDYSGRLSALTRQVYADVSELPVASLFDAVLMIEVVEHLSRPLDTLCAVREHLLPTGQLFVTTPSGDLRRKDRNRESWDTYRTPQHVQYFTDKSMRCCLRAAGFRRIRYRYIMELYPTENLQDEILGSRWARRYALRQYVRYWLCGTRHLTLFAR